MIICCLDAPLAIGPYRESLNIRGRSVRQPFVVIRTATYSEWLADIENPPRFGDVSVDLRALASQARYFYEITTD